MMLLDDIFKNYNDKWFYAYVGGHKEKSFIRFIEIKHNNKTLKIRAFSFYQKTGRVQYVDLSNLKHLNCLQIIEDMDDETEDSLNALFAKTLLTKK